MVRFKVDEAKDQNHSTLFDHSGRSVLTIVRNMGVQ